MKRLTSLLLVLALCSTAFAQKKAMLEEGKVWTYTYHHFEATEESEGLEYDHTAYPVSFRLEGKARVNGKEYFQVFRSIDGGEPLLYAYVREDGSATYLLMVYSKTEAKLTEFNADRFENDIWRNSLTDHQDIININGETYLRHTYTSDSPRRRYVAVEGIGFKEKGLILGNDYEVPECVCDYMVFEACYEGDRLIFTNDDFEAASMGLPTGIAAPAAEGSERLTCKDLQGRNVHGKVMQRGVYIVNGKKVIR